MAERINSIARVFLAAAVIAVCLVAPTVRAQGIDPLPDPTKTTFTQDDIAQINAYMGKRVGLMGGDDAEAREKARFEIQQPLRRAGVSVAFRRHTREATIGPLTTLADDRSEGGDIAINALFVLAEIADDASRLVVQQHTDDDILAVRYAAVGAMKRTFRVIDTFQPAIDAGRVSEMVIHLQRRLAEEEDANVAFAIVGALLQASLIQREGFQTPSTQALIAAASGVGTRLREAEGGDRLFAMMSCHRVGEELVALLRTPETPRPEVSKAAAAFGAEVLARLTFEARDGRIGDERAAEVRLAQIAELCIKLARLKLGDAADDRNLAALLEGGRDQEFFNQVSRYVLGLSGGRTSLPTEDMKRIQDALDGG